MIKKVNDCSVMIYIN